MPSSFFICVLYHFFYSGFEIQGVGMKNHTEKFVVQFCTTNLVSFQGRNKDGEYRQKIIKDNCIGGLELFLNCEVSSKEQIKDRIKVCLNDGRQIGYLEQYLSDKILYNMKNNYSYHAFIESVNVNLVGRKKVYSVKIRIDEFIWKDDRINQALFSLLFVFGGGSILTFLYRWFF